MYYQRLNEIELRFKRTLSLMVIGKMNAGTLAKELGVSQPTVIRTIAELRRRGYLIHAVRDRLGWYYEMVTVGGYVLKRRVKDNGTSQNQASASG